MRTVRARRLFLIMILSALALIVRLHEAQASESLDLAKICSQLEQVAASPGPWAINHEPRQKLLLEVFYALNSHPIDKQSEPMREIAAKMHEILRQTRRPSEPPPSIVTSIMNLGDFWSAQELPYLLDLIRTDYEFIPPALRILPHLTDEQKKSVNDSIHQRLPRADNYMFLYKVGLANRKDLVTLVRLLEGLFIVGHNLSETASSTIYGAPIFGEFSDNSLESETLKRITNLYTRHDFTMMSVVKEAQKLGPIFPPLYQTQRDHHASRQFYRILTTTGFTDCGSELE